MLMDVMYEALANSNSADEQPMLVQTRYPYKTRLDTSSLTQPPPPSVKWARRIYAALTAGHDVTVTYQRASNAERFDPARRLTQAIEELGKTREADGTTSALA